MTQNKIHIFSQPIRTGKTTLLLNWVKGQKSIGGILMPDIEGKRKIYDIHRGIYHDMELDEDNNDLFVIQVGKFKFSGEVFELSKEVLRREMDFSPEWLVVDEVGKLEIEHNSGFEPMISTLIEYYKRDDTKGNLLLVIRDSLLAKAFDLYELDASMLVNRSFFEHG